MKAFPYLAATLGALLLAAMIIRIAIVAIHHSPDASAVASAAPRVATTPAIEAGWGNLASTDR